MHSYLRIGTYSALFVGGRNSGSLVKSIAVVEVMSRGGDGDDLSFSSMVGKMTARFETIPMRLTIEERRLLNVLENALEVTEYTDNVDVTFSHTKQSKQSRIIEGLVDTLSIACGLLLSNNLSKGESLMEGKTLTENVPFFSDLFEIGRRYKIMNPAKMKGTYGKLMYILMDTESCGIKDKLKVSFVKPIQTVGLFLKQRDCLDILEDPLLHMATISIGNECKDKTASEIAREIDSKNKATVELISKYSSRNLMTEEQIRRVIDSIGDNEAYLRFNVGPVERILAILTESFSAKEINGHYSLELSGGRSAGRRILNKFSSLSVSVAGGGTSRFYTGEGACLSHDHSTQYAFVLQTFTLWKEIMSRMPKLWLLSDTDMTTEGYRLVDTGQGYQRLQSCPSVSSEMRKILRNVQNRFNNWVGLSVVHLGDRDVPNSLVFIDKYTQVPSILSPIVQCIERLPSLVEDNAFHEYVSSEWGSINDLRMQILSDFFKHGFDGSGDDGGSCIDGRLTSSWNWCSKLQKKPYYFVFMFTGFQGFDGEF